MNTIYMIKTLRISPPEENFRISCSRVNISLPTQHRQIHHTLKLPQVVVSMVGSCESDRRIMTASFDLSFEANRRDARSTQAQHSGGCRASGSTQGHRRRTVHGAAQQRLSCHMAWKVETTSLRWLCETITVVPLTTPPHLSTAFELQVRNIMHSDHRI